MPVILESELRSAANRMPFWTLGSTATRSSATRTVFLSHSSKDKDLVRLVSTILEGQGISVYVDWQDGELPAVVSAKTASTLRTRICNCQMLLLLATNNALESRWVPWELGYADGKITWSRVAIIEVARNGEKYLGNEYVDFYQKLSLPGEGVDRLDELRSRRATASTNEEVVSVREWLRK